MISSNNMQNLQLQYRHNIVVKSRAIIFVFDELHREGMKLEKLIYKNASARGEMAKEYFENVLKFTNVEVLLNPTKA